MMMMTFVSWYFILNNREHLLLFTWTGLLLSHDWRSKIRTGDLLSPLTSVMNSLDRDLPRVLTNVRCRQFVAFLVSCLLVPSTWLWRHAVHRLSSLTAWPKYCNFVFMATRRLRLVVTFFERRVKKFLLSLLTYLLTHLLANKTNTNLGDGLELQELALLRFDACEVISYGHVTSEMILGFRAQPVNHLFTQQYISAHFCDYKAAQLSCKNLTEKLDWTMLVVESWYYRRRKGCEA